jgi:hypothetical protein
MTRIPPGTRRNEKTLVAMMTFKRSSNGLTVSNPSPSQAPALTLPIDINIFRMMPVLNALRHF